MFRLIFGCSLLFALFASARSQGACPTNWQTWGPGTGQALSGYGYWCGDQTAVLTTNTNNGVVVSATCSAGPPTAYYCDLSLPLEGTIGSDLVNGDMAGMPLTKTSPGACYSACAQTSGCIQWSFNICGNNQCWLKNSAGIPTSPVTCAVSAAMPPPTTPPPPPTGSQNGQVAIRITSNAFAVGCEQNGPVAFASFGQCVPVSVSSNLYSFWAMITNGVSGSYTYCLNNGAPTDTSCPSGCLYSGTGQYGSCATLASAAGFLMVYQTQLGSTVYGSFYHDSSCAQLAPASTTTSNPLPAIAGACTSTVGITFWDVNSYWVAAPITTGTGASMYIWSGGCTSDCFTLCNYGGTTVADTCSVVDTYSTIKLSASNPLNCALYGQYSCPSACGAWCPALAICTLDCTPSSSGGGSSTSSGGLPLGAIIGIAVGGVVILALVAATLTYFLWWRPRSSTSSSRAYE